MDSELLSQILSILLPALATLIAGWFAILGNKIKTAYQEKINTQIKKQVVQTTVEYVQQVYKQLEGPEKLQKAIQQATIVLGEKGIIVSEMELRILIEAAVFGLKQGFNYSNDEDEEQNELEPGKEEQPALPPELQEPAQEEE